MSEAGSSRGTWLAALLVALLVAAAFQPAFDAEFINFDDDRNITENHAFRGLDGEHLTWMFTTNWMGPYQPLSWLSLAVDHALWGLGGPREFPEAPLYHRTNVALHALAAGAFVFLARALLRRSGKPAREVLFASAAAALLFGAHPLRVESVAWVTERRDVLSGLFIVLAAVAWLRRFPGEGAPPRVTRRAWGAAVAALVAWLAFAISVDRSGATALAWRGPGAFGLGVGLAALGAACHLAGGERARGASWFALLLFAAALLSKGLVVVFPVVLLVVDGWPLRRLTRESWLACVLEKAPLFALSLAFGQLAIWGQAGQVGGLADLADHGLAERLAQAFYGLARYPLATLVPFALRPIYELPASLSLAEPRFALAAASVVAVTITLWRGRARRPGALAAWVAFAVAVAPVVGLTQTGPQLVADRYTYLSCMPFAVLAGGAVLATGRVGRVLAIAAIAAYAGATWRYTQAWRDSETLWEYTLEVDPDNVPAMLNRATARARLAQLEPDGERRIQVLGEARDLLERGLEVRRDPRFLGNLARVHAQLGEPEVALDYSEQALELAREQGVLIPNYYLSYGLDLLGVGRAAEALEALERVLAAEPRNFAALMAAGWALSALERPGPAAARFEAAAQLEASSVQAWRRAALAHQAAGQREPAIRAWRRVLSLVPDHPGARAHLDELGTAR